MTHPHPAEVPSAVLAAALAFVHEEAGFAQVTTIDRHGFPVGRSMTAFLNDDWSVDLVQRRSHARLAQLRRDPRTLVTWVGEPAPGATNERPHVFDIGRLPARAVFVRGTARFMDDAATVACYSRHVARQRAQGFTRAPLRDADQVLSDLAGVHLEPYRVRLEGFGTGAQSFDWTLSPPDRPRPLSPPQGET
jgi:Pyridoxamine 5'-phosphate oxidase